MAKNAEIEQTVIEAPYELPEGWKWCRLGDCATYINGRAFKPEEWETQGKPIIRIQNLTNTSDSVNRTTKQFEEKYLIKNNDLLYAWSASLGAHIWHDEDGWLNQHIFKVVPNDQISKMYLYYSLVRVTDNLYAKTHGSGMVHVTLKPFLNTTIPLPPTLAEQQRIVNRIESMFAKLDEAKEKAQNVVDSFETRKAAILHKAFTGELTANWRKENGLPDDSWEEKRFDEFCLLKRGFDLPATQRIEGKYPLVSSSGIIDSHNEQKVKGPCVITGRSGSIGKVFYISEDCFPLNTTLYSEQLYGNNARFVFFYLQTFDFKKYSSSTAVPTLNRNNFANVIVNIPSLFEQQEIVRILDTVLEKESCAKEAAQTVLYKIALLKKSILARAFRGKI